MAEGRAPRRALKKTLYVAGLLTLLAQAPNACAARVTISCGSVGKEFDVCKSGAQAWARQSGNEVSVLESPSSAGERLSQMHLLLAARSSDIDVFLIDTTWPGMLSDFFVDLNTNAEIRKRVPEYFPAFIRNNTVSGHLIAVPWFIDAGVLYYRRDLLERYHERVPKTWTELTRIARRIQEGERKSGANGFWGYVFQGRAYEGLTCNALEWVDSYGGGTFVDPASGEVTLLNPRAEAALSLAASWIDTISPRGVLNSMEEEARGVFQSGNAAFLRNWPYVWKLANAPDSLVRGKVGLAPLPRGVGPGARHASTLGGWSLAVSRFSEHPIEAASLVAYLTSSAEEKRRVELLGQTPTLTALYKDPELLRSHPELSLLFPVFESAVPRPSSVTGAKYTRVSSEIWEAAHSILAQKVSAHDGLLHLRDRLNFLRRGGRW